VTELGRTLAAADVAITALLVNWHSASDLHRAAASLRARAFRPARVRFLIVDNTGGRDRGLSELAAPDVDLLAVDPGERRGSWGHAFGLACGFERITTPYALVSDPDVHVFLRGWDERLIGAMKGSGAITAGAPYPWWKLGKYHDFPSPVFALLDVPAIRRIGVDWTPFATKPLRRGYDLVARQVVRLGGMATRRRLLAMPRLATWARRLEKVLGVCGPDTGYRIAAAARRAGAGSLLLDVAGPADVSPVGSAANALALEFELFYHQGLPAVAHRYSSRSRLWRTERGHDDQYFRECIARLEQRDAP